MRLPRRERRDPARLDGDHRVSQFEPVAASSPSPRAVRGWARGRGDPAVVRRQDLVRAGWHHGRQGATRFSALVLNTVSRSHYLFAVLSLTISLRLPRLCSFCSFRQLVTCIPQRPAPAGCPTSPRLRTLPGRAAPRAGAPKIYLQFSKIL